MTLEEVALALADVRLDLRMRVLPGLNGSILIDDSYNASPPSVLGALDLLAELPGRRIAVLGPMAELGAASAEGNLRVGESAARSCDVLVVVGEEAVPIAEAARSAGARAVRTCDGVEAAAERLHRELSGRDHVLIKGSRAAGLESLVDALVAR
jgi:UDP-N-acetylmuramoyl-tripeptide--D-alanyl-D-alanine ligase